MYKIGTLYVDTKKVIGASILYTGPDIGDTRG